MSQYNTGNPPPSSDMRDAWDNNATIDDFVNGPQLTVTTRTGVEWDSLSGIQKKAEDQREQIAIDSEAVVDETRRNLIPLSRQYMTLAEAQADIANIPEGSVTYYRSPDDTALAIEVINNSGALAATGRKMPSQQQVNKAANSAQLAGVTVEEPLYDEEGVEIVHALADADGKAPLTTNRLGAVGLARAEVAALGGNAVPWAITDSRRIPYISGTPMGGVQIGNVEIVEIPGPPGIVFCDANYIPMACTPGFDSDQDIPVIGGSGNTPETPVIPIYLRDWNGVRSQGQSLSIGEMPPASAAANPPLSTSQPYGNLGFSSNNNSYSSATDTAVPLVESAYMPSEGTYPAGESPCSGAANKLVDRIQAETGFDWQQQGAVFFSSCPGRGGTQIANLSKGTASYQRALDHVTNSMRLANVAGRTFAELAILWTQGESDIGGGVTRADYYSMLTQYISDMTTDTVAITGQDFTPFFISYQMASHRQYRVTNPLIALALRDVALTGLSRLSHPAYIGDYVDNVHGTNQTYLMFAKYYGRAVHKLLQDNQAGKKPGMHWLDKIGETRQGNIINLQFNVPHPPLVIDTTWVTEAENYGFYIRDMTTQNFDVVDIISAVEIAGPDRVRIICSRAPTVNEQVTYGWGKAGDPLTTGRTTGPRGNLRDSEGDLPGESYTDTSGTLRKLHNWCVIF
ncbi:sialate O-acetylesterase [Klebsiella aerogenes]